MKVTLTDYDKKLHDPKRVVAKRAIRTTFSMAPKPAVRPDDPAQRFVIFSRGRSGTTLLVNLVGHNPDVYCDGEILRHWKYFPEAYVLKRMRDAQSKWPFKAYGFKLLSYQLDEVLHLRRERAMAEWLQRNGFRMIYVLRRNLLRLAFSNIWARHYGFHSAKNRAERHPDKARTPIVVEQEDLMWWLHGLTRKYRDERAFLDGSPHLEIVYEDDLAEPEQWEPTMNRFFDYIGVDRAPVETTFKRTTPETLDQIVANHEDVRAWLAGTEFEAHLEGF